MGFLKITLLSFFLITLTAGCNSSEKNTISVEASSVQAENKDDFSDLKPKEGGCTKEEDIKKKLEEESQKKSGFKLQGGKTDCKVQ